MSATTATNTLNLGFLTILNESNTFSGAYFVTNFWGRPIDFRLTTTVQPNQVQKILYAGTLHQYICAELIGKTLLDKTNIAVQMIVTDTPAALTLRLFQDTPVAWIARAARVNPDAPTETPQLHEHSCPTMVVRNNIHCHADFPEDAPVINEILDRLTGNVDLAEPFLRIREAMGEARKMGVGSRG